MSERTTSSSWARGIVKAWEMDGRDWRALFQQVGQDLEALDDPDARFPQDSRTRLARRAAAVARTDDAGWEVAGSAFGGNGRMW
ncbi:hypothetical protein B1218_34825 [Pseudomonas ogarae]|nr:hypothetical protein B1218_34825 [Pseudomonas ogarae]